MSHSSFTTDVGAVSSAEWGATGRPVSYTHLMITMEELQGYPVADDKEIRDAHNKACLLYTSTQIIVLCEIFHISFLFIFKHFSMQIPFMYNIGSVTVSYTHLSPYI